MLQYYTAIVLFSVFSMLVMDLCVRSADALTKQEQRLFFMEFSGIAIAALCEWLGVMLQGAGHGTRVLHIAVKTLEFSLAPVVGMLVAWVLEHKKQPLAVGLLALHAVLEVFSGFFGFIFYVDENSVYYHGRFYWIYIAAYGFAALYTVLVVLRNARHYQARGGPFIVGVVLFLFGGIVVQTINSELRIDYLVISISAIMLFCYTQEVTHQTDALTGLINRRGYDSYTSHLTETCRILFFDVDKFKEINDTYGHAMGDKCLQLTGQALRDTYGRHGRCFRIGGDEFCVILPGTSEMPTGLNASLAKRMKSLRAQEPTLPKLSYGSAAYDPKVDTFQDAVDRADQEMYRFKQSARRR